MQAAAAVVVQQALHAQQQGTGQPVALQVRQVQHTYYTTCPRVGIWHAGVALALMAAEALLMLLLR
jgi:hypothetical protein